MDDKAIVTSFMVECENTKLAYGLFRALFDRGKRQRQLFHSIAPKMFGDLNAILIEHFYLQVSNLTDPAKTQGKFANLTTNYLVECIVWPDAVEGQLSATNRRLMAFGEHFEEYRNKRGAHLDLDAHTDQRRTFGAYPEGDDKRFFQNLDEFLQVAVRYFDPNEIISLDITMSDDVDGLVKAIERSAAFERCTGCKPGERAKAVLDHRLGP